MNKEIFISMEKIVISGDVLDAGVDNYGIVYQLYKHYNNEVEVEHFDSNRKLEEKKDAKYDCCLLVFTLHKFLSRRSRESFLREISEFLKEDGYIYLWDIDKGLGKKFDSLIKILLPDRSIKKIRIKDLNLLKNSSKEKNKAVIEKFFFIEEYTSSNQVFFVKARKKGK